MSIRSKMKFGGGLPVGGRSSGGRPKKKVKYKLKKSRARKSAERAVGYAKDNLRDLRKLTNKRQQNRARTGTKVRKQEMQAARKIASQARDYERMGYRKLAGDARAEAKTRRAKARTGLKGAEAHPPVTREHRKQGDRSYSVQAAGKSLVKRKKKLANTPRQGGKVRISSGNRNMFLQEPKLSDH